MLAANRTGEDFVFTELTSFIKQYNPSHFFTLTYGRRVGHDARMHFFNEWTDALEWMQRRPLGWLRADEMKRWSGCGRPEIPEHHHGLLFGATDLSCGGAEALWRDIAGDALVEKYDPYLGGVAYTLKHALHPIGDWDIGGMKAFRQSGLPHLPLSVPRHQGPTLVDKSNHNVERLKASAGDLPYKKMAGSK